MVVKWLVAGSRWGSSRRTPRPPNRLGIWQAPPHAPPRRLRCFDFRAFGAQHDFQPQIFQFHPWNSGC